MSLANDESRSSDHQSILHALGAIRIVPVLVIDDAQRATHTALALAAGGIGCAEITLRTPAALDAIAAASATTDFIIGAGTVLTPEHVDASVDAGARFIVSPGLDESVIERAKERGVLVIPGVATATEVQRALRLGLDHLKFFPAHLNGGLQGIQALSAPLAAARFMPSGGVDESTAVAYLRDPAVYAVSGSWMATRAAIAEGHFDDIETLSARARAAVTA